MNWLVISLSVVVEMQLKQDEINGILTDFNEPGHLAPVGLHMAGTKYMVIQGEPGAVIRGKKVFRRGERPIYLFFFLILFRSLFILILPPLYLKYKILLPLSQ